MLIGDWSKELKSLHRGRTAIVDTAHQRTLTYDDLAERVELTAKALSQEGVRRGSRVAVLSKNRAEFFEILLACGRLGALFIPLNWRLTHSELEWLLSDASPTFILAEAAFSDVIPPSLLSFTRHFGNEWEALLQNAAHRPSQKQVELSPDDPWIVLYTSGTTGHPKGALLPYRQVAFNALNTIAALSLRPTDTTVTYMPLFHTGGLNVLSTPLLIQGGCLILTDGFDAEAFWELHHRYQTTLLFGVPTTLTWLAQSSAFERADLSTIRFALCGGAPCPLSLIETFSQRQIIFKQGYGLTEVGPNCLNLHEDDVIRKAGAAGLPNLGIAARVYQEDGSVLAGPGEGELALGGPCLFLGYLNHDDSSESVFTEDGYFLTGDVVRVDSDGYMSIIDRSKDMFISGGENVFPAEIERVLSDHPQVQGVAVVGVEDCTWGEVGRAFIEPVSPSSSINIDVFREWARAHLAGFKVPKQFVLVQTLPRNASGKIQKHLLFREVIQ